MNKSSILAVATCTALVFGAAGARALSRAELVRDLRQGGYVLVMRHASSPAQPPQGQAADPANVGHERQLDDAGRRAAVAMGRAVRALHLPIGDVWTSPTFRARQTAGLAGLPKPTSVAELGDGGRSMSKASAGQAAWLRAKVAEPPRRGTDTVIVTQLPNIAAAFGEAANGLQDGGALVFRPSGDGAPQPLARIVIGEWPQLAREH
jgi:hypothetical protein